MNMFCFILSESPFLNKTTVTSRTAPYIKTMTHSFFKVYICLPVLLWPIHWMILN